MSGLSWAVFEKTKRTAEAALANELVTRERVTLVESQQAKVERVLKGGFWQRLRWLLLGGTL